MTSREHRDIVRRAREAWVSAFFFSQLDVGSFSGPQLSALCDHELRIGKRLTDGVIAVSAMAETPTAGVARSN